MSTKAVKKGMFARVGVLALALTLVSSSMMFSTLAKYTSEVTVAGSAEVAKWAISFKGNANTGEAGEFTADSTIALTDTTLGAKVTDGKIAPGTDGQFTAKVDGTGSEVGYMYSITIEDLANKPTNLKFYSDSTHDTEIVVNDNKAVVAADVPVELSAVGTPVTRTVYWKWAYSGDAAADVADTANGVTAADMTFKLVLNATQLDPTAATN